MDLVRKWPLLILRFTRWKVTCLFHLLIIPVETMMPDEFEFKGKGYQGYLCNQLFPQFPLNIFKLMIVKPSGIYPIPIHQVKSGQSSLFYNMNLYFMRHVPINQPSLSTILLNNRSQGEGACVVQHFLLNLIVSLFALVSMTLQVCHVISDQTCCLFKDNDRCYWWLLWLIDCGSI